MTRKRFGVRVDPFSGEMLDDGGIMPPMAKDVSQPVLDEESLQQAEEDNTKGEKDDDK